MSESDSNPPQARLSLNAWLIPAVGLVALGEAARWLLGVQGLAGAARAVGLTAWGLAWVWFLSGLFGLAQPRRVLWTCLYLAVLGGGIGLMELSAGLSSSASVGVLLAACAGSVALVYRAFRPAPRYRRPAALTAVAFAVIAASWACRRQGHVGLGTAIMGMGAMGLGFAAGLALLHRLLDGRRPLFGVAQTVIREAIRMRVALVLIVFVVGTLPVLPLILDPAERVSYRLQFFLTWSLSGITFLFGLMSIFLACGTVRHDLESKQSHMTLTKPVRRWEYLAGKWVGITALSALLIAVTGAGVYTFARILATQTPRNEQDRIAITDEVLTAREVTIAKHPDPKGFEEGFLKVVEERESTLNAKLTDRDRRELREEYVQKWCHLFPEGRESYLFTGLAEARRVGGTVQFRFKPLTANAVVKETVTLRMMVWLNDRPWPIENNRHAPVELPSGLVHTLSLPAESINDRGELKLTLENRSVKEVLETAPPTFFFIPEKLEVLYRVGGFELNLAKALAVTVAKVSLLAAVGLAAACFLDFPVACLLGLMVFAVAGASGFVSQALVHYAGIDSPDATWVQLISYRWRYFVEEIEKGEYWIAAKLAGAVVSQVIVAFWPSFGDYDVVDRLAGGRWVPGTLVAQAVLVLGVLWSTLVGLLGWGIMENTDVARVTV